VDLRRLVAVDTVIIEVLSRQRLDAIQNAARCGVARCGRRL
jgi:hypothetical protein